MKRILRLVGNKIIRSKNLRSRIFAVISGLTTYLIKNNNSKKSNKSTAIIVTYHRVEDISFDPHKLCVSVESFTSHMAFYSKNFETVSLDEMFYRVNSNKLTGREISVTFDDGYYDNIINALPVAEAFNIPITIFLCTSQLGLRGNQAWNMGYKKGEDGRFITEDEIKEYAKHELIEFGGHTVNHARLSTLSRLEQYAEIEKNKVFLERATGKFLQYFAYPYGGAWDFDEITIDLLKRLGFKYAFANYSGYISNKTNKYKIPRFNIRECGVDQLEILLKKR